MTIKRRIQIFMNLIGKDERYLYGFFCVAMLLKYSMFGFRYYPVLDDFVQYGLYPHIEQNIWQNVLIGGAKTIYVRPLAGIFDVFVWGKLWGHLWIVLIIIIIMHSVSGILFYKSFQRMRLSLTPVFLIIYGFLPLSAEGTFWISASSRIVVSLFFMSISVYMLIKYINEEKKYALAVYLIALICSCSFYEPALVLSLFLSVCVMLFYSAYSLLGFPFSVFTLFLVYYGYFGKFGENSERLKILSNDELVANIQVVFHEIGYLWGDATASLFTRGFLRSFRLIAENAGWLWLALVITAGVVLTVFFKNRAKSNIPLNIFKIICGIIIMFVPYIPFFISSNSAVNFRTAVPSFIGIALIIDALLQIVFTKKGKALGYIACVMFCVFTVIHYSEVHDYNVSGKADMELTERIAEEISAASIEHVVYFNAREDTPYFEQNIPLSDHIARITLSNGWSISGAVRAYTKIRNIKVIDNNADWWRRHK